MTLPRRLLPGGPESEAMAAASGQCRAALSAESEPCLSEPPGCPDSEAARLTRPGGGVTVTAVTTARA